MIKERKQHTSRGAALLIFVLLFLVASTVLVFGIGRGVYQDIVQYRTLENSKISFFMLEAGIEDAVYRHRVSLDYSNSETFSIGDATVTLSRVFFINRWMFEAVAEAHGAYRKGYLELGLGDGASFTFGLQSDTGGILMENSSSVLGNIYSNGAVIGTGGGSGNLVTGSIISTGPTGYIDGVHATGSVWSNTIVNALIDGNARCDSIDQSTVGGVLYCNTVTATTPNPADFPGPPDQATTSLPIDDETIATWKLEAEAGELIASTSPQCSGGTWTIDSSTTTGPAVIECNVSVDKSGTVWTLGGTIWIKGDLTAETGAPEIRIDPSDPLLEGVSIQVIVHDPDDTTTGSKVDLKNSAVFTGHGEESYILLISQNNDEEGAGAGGGGEKAIRSRQSANGDVLLYAGHGEILIEQSGQFIGVAGLLLHLQNSAQIIYETGAISLDFPSGPGGGYEVDVWKEVP